MRQVHAALIAALLCAAGCQSDVDLRPADKQHVYGAASDDLLLLSDTRRVTIDFRTPPVNKDIDSDTVFVYLSLPLHPINGPEFNNISLGGGWQDAAMSFNGLFQPFPKHLAYWDPKGLDPNASLVEWPEGTGLHRPAEPSPDMNKVDERYAEYAAALMAAAQQQGKTADAVAV